MTARDLTVLFGIALAVSIGWGYWEHADAEAARSRWLACEGREVAVLHCGEVTYEVACPDKAEVAKKE